MYDDSGRVSKMFFPRQGKKFDYDLKQIKVFCFKLQLSGDLLMELGAGVELATAATPQLFLPLACAANIGKVAYNDQEKAWLMNIFIIQVHSQENNHVDQEVTQTNGIVGEVEPQNGDVLGDLLSPLAIEGPPGVSVSGTETLSEDGALALAPV